MSIYVSDENGLLKLCAHQNVCVCVLIMNLTHRTPVENCIKCCVINVVMLRNSRFARRAESEPKNHL